MLSPLTKVEPFTLGIDSSLDAECERPRASSSTLRNHSRTGSSTAAPSGLAPACQPSHSSDSTPLIVALAPSSSRCSVAPAAAAVAPAPAAAITEARVALLKLDVLVRERLAQSAETPVRAAELGGWVHEWQSLCAAQAVADLGSLLWTPTAAAFEGELIITIISWLASQTPPCECLAEEVLGPLVERVCAVACDLFARRVESPPATLAPSAAAIAAAAAAALDAGLGAVPLPVAGIAAPAGAPAPRRSVWRDRETGVGIACGGLWSHRLLSALARVPLAPGGSLDVLLDAIVSVQRAHARADEGVIIEHARTALADAASESRGAGRPAALAAVWRQMRDMAARCARLRLLAPARDILFRLRAWLGKADHAAACAAAGVTEADLAAVEALFSWCALHADERTPPPPPPEGARLPSVFATYAGAARESSAATLAAAWLEDACALAGSPPDGLSLALFALGPDAAWHQPLCLAYEAPGRASEASEAYIAAVGTALVLLRMGLAAHVLAAPARRHVGFVVAASVAAVAERLREDPNDAVGRRLRAGVWLAGARELELAWQRALVGLWPAAEHKTLAAQALTMHLAALSRGALPMRALCEDIAFSAQQYGSSANLERLVARRVVHPLVALLLRVGLAYEAASGDGSGNSSAGGESHPSAALAPRAELARVCGDWVREAAARGPEARVWQSAADKALGLVCASAIRSVAKAAPALRFADGDLVSLFFQPDIPLSLEPRHRQAALAVALGRAPLARLALIESDMAVELAPYFEIAPHDSAATGHAVALEALDWRLFDSAASRTDMWQFWHNSRPHLLRATLVLRSAEREPFALRGRLLRALLELDSSPAAAAAAAAAHAAPGAALAPNFAMADECAALSACLAGLGSAYDVASNWLGACGTFEALAPADELIVPLSRDRLMALLLRLWLAQALAPAGTAYWLAGVIDALAAHRRHLPGGRLSAEPLEVSAAQSLLGSLQQARALEALTWACGGSHAMAALAVALAARAGASGDGASLATSAKVATAAAAAAMAAAQQATSHDSPGTGLHGPHTGAGTSGSASGGGGGAASPSAFAFKTLADLSCVPLVEHWLEAVSWHAAGAGLVAIPLPLHGKTLKAVEGQFLTRCIIRTCPALTGSMLAKLVAEATSLLLLDVTGCTAVDVLPDLGRCCPQLRSLIVAGTSIKSLRVPGHTLLTRHRLTPLALESVSHVDCSDCASLRVFELRAPALRSLVLRGALAALEPPLVLYGCGASTRIRLDMNDCPSLTDARLTALLAQLWNWLGEISAAGCAGLSPALRVAPALAHSFAIERSGAAVPLDLSAVSLAVLGSARASDPDFRFIPSTLKLRVGELPRTTDYASLALIVTDTPLPGLYLVGPDASFAGAASSAPLRQALEASALRELTLTALPLSATWGELLGSLAVSKPSLVTLNLSGAQLAPGAGEALLAALAHAWRADAACSLRSLGLANCGVGAPALDGLRAVGFGELRHLELAGNALGDAGALALAQALAARRACALEALLVQACDIGSAGAHALVQALLAGASSGAHGALASVNLSANPIGSDGGEALCLLVQQLPVGAALRSVNASACQLDESCGMRLLALMRAAAAKDAGGAACVLRELVLFANDISQATAAELSKFGILI